jgi:ubiquinone/menaquinone biosynthesis C-methylase UbiE
MPIKKLLRDPFKRFLFEVGAGYYARKLATGPEADIRQEFVASLRLPPAHLNPDLKFLDVGCGPGHVARSLAASGYNVTGVDRCHSLLRIARRLGSRIARPDRLAFHHSTTDKLPFGDATFDVTYATGVIYWVEHLPETLREIVRVTRPNGMVAFLDPHASMSIANAREYSRRRGLSRRDTRKMVAWATSARFNRRFEEVELRRALADAGLEQIHLERRLDGMVWFTRARTPAAATAMQESVAIEPMETVLAS